VDQEMPACSPVYAMDATFFFPPAVSEDLLLQLTSALQHQHINNNNNNNSNAVPPKTLTKILNSSHFFALN